METKDLVLLMLIPIILVSLVVYTDKNPAITGAVTAKQEESNVIGTYSINPSFKAKIDYDLNDYKTIKESLENIKNCAQSKDIQSCVNDINNNMFRWELGCDKGAEKVLYDFAEFFQDCIDSEDSNCLCRKNVRISDEDLRKYELLNKEYKMTLTQDISSNKIEIKMLEPNIDLFYDVKIGSKSRSTWYPNDIVLAYVENKIVLVFKNIKEEVLMKKEPYYYALPQDKKEIIAFKSRTNNIDYLDFLKQENNNLKYPNEQFVVDANNQPIDINNIQNCQTKPKNIYRFCVTKKDYKIIAYDKLDGQVKERPLTIKFAAYIPPKQNP